MALTHMLPGSIPPDGPYIILAAPRSILGDTERVFALIDACTAILGQPVVLLAQDCLDTLVPELLAPVFANPRDDSGGGIARPS